MLQHSLVCPPVDFSFRYAHASCMTWRMDSRAQPRNIREREELVELMAAVVRGDRVAFASVYQRTSAKLYGICLQVLQNEAEAQEVLQDVYLALWRKAGIFDQNRASPITWLATLARNRSVDRLRSRRTPGEDLGLAADVVDEGPSSLEVLEQAQDALRLRDCLDELEGRPREMIRAAFFQGASYPQLAEREGVPLPTVKSWIRRGLQRLRRCLEQ